MKIRSAVLALKQWARHPYGLPFSRRLTRQQALTPTSVAALNLRLRRELVRMAFRDIPFYNNKYTAAGFTFADLEAPDIFEKLPILEKREVAEHSAWMIHPRYRSRRLPEATTGGSTGAPLKTYSDPHIPLHFMSWRMLGWWGVDIGAPSGYLYRNVPEDRDRFFQQAMLWPTRRDWLSAATMTPAKMEGFHRSLYRKRVEYLVGYVGAVDVFASFLRERSLTLPHLKAVWTTAAPLPEGKRGWLEEVFRAPVYTQYGSCEFYWIAAECAVKRGLHVGNDIRHVEVVRGASVVEDGEFGDIIVTDLVNKAFPLIRYRIGDEGRMLPERCSCGLPFPLLDYVRGRITESILTKSGARIPGEYWTTICDDLSASVKAFQVHQFRDRTVQILYQMHDGADAGPVIESLSARMKAQFGGDLDVRLVEGVVNVNENGKTRFVVSEAMRAEAAAVG